SQNGGAAQGAIGNLSDNVAHGGTDLGTGDSIADRTFTIDHGVLIYSGFHADQHAVGMSPNHQPILGVAPFDVTPNPGGVYIIAVCPVGSSAPADCKFDAFKTARCNEQPPPGCVPLCPEWDPTCIQCPPQCDPNCVQTDWGSTCTPCPPSNCDP